MITNQQTKGRIALKSIALPTEHGGWGFLIEPILLGLLIAFSWQGVLLAIAAAGVFLIHQPIKIVAKDRLKERRPPRFVWAMRFTMIYALLAIIPMIGLLVWNSPAFLLPIALAAPMAMVQLYFDAQNRSRHLVPEIAGAAALAMIAPSIVILDGWTFGTAIVLWIILSIRAAAAILHVRTRIHLKIGKPTSVVGPWLMHAAALTIAIGLAVLNMAPWLTAIAFTVLLVRSLIGLSEYRKDQPIKVIGFQELGYGLMTVLMVAIGYSLNL